MGDSRKMSIPIPQAASWNFEGRGGGGVFVLEFLRQRICINSGFPKGENRKSFELETAVLLTRGFKKKTGNSKRERGGGSV